MVDDRIASVMPKASLPNSDDGETLLRGDRLVDFYRASYSDFDSSSCHSRAKWRNTFPGVGAGVVSSGGCAGIIPKDYLPRGAGFLQMGEPPGGIRLNSPDTCQG
jgi:hypothetical protein